MLDLLADGGSGYVVRTAWLYGAHGPNFVRTMIELERRRPAIDVVDDQHGQPSWTVDVAGQIIALVRSGAAGGVYHATSSGETTWFGLAREVFGLLGADPTRVRATTSECLSAPRGPAVLQRARPRWLGEGRPRADRRLAASPAARLSGSAHRLRGGQPDWSVTRTQRSGTTSGIYRQAAVAQAGGVGEAVGVPGQKPVTLGLGQRRRSGILRVTGQARHRRASRSLRRGLAGRRHVPGRACRASSTGRPPHTRRSMP